MLHIGFGMAITFALLQIDGICFVRVHSMSMYRSQGLALLPRCCSISVSRPTFGGVGKRWLIYINFQTPNFHVRAMHSWHRHVHPGNYGRAYPDFSVLALWNGMSGHRLTEGGTECLGGIFQTGSMCGPCRQLALGPSA